MLSAGGRWFGGKLGQRIGIKLSTALSAAGATEAVNQILRSRIVGLKLKGIQ